MNSTCFFFVAQNTFTTHIIINRIKQEPRMSSGHFPLPLKKGGVEEEKEMEKKTKEM